MAGWRNDPVPKPPKAPALKGGFRVPAIIRWPGQVKPGLVENGIFSGLDWFPTLAAAAGNLNITDQLLKGVALEGRTYKNHLDGYKQTALLTGKGLPLAMRSSTLPVRILAHFAMMTSSSNSSSSRTVGRERKPPPTCLLWSIFARTRSSERHQFAVRV
jgi:Sulfatase